MDAILKKYSKVVSTNKTKGINMCKQKNKAKAEKTEEIYEISSEEYAILEEDERDQWSPVKAKYEKIPKVCFVTFGIAAICGIIYIIALFNADFADFINLYPGTAVRFILAKLSGILPFSLAEAVILLIPFICFIGIWYLTKFRCDTRRSSIVSIVCILSVSAMLLSSFVLCLGIGYKGNPLEDKLGLVAEPVEVTELSDSTKHLIDKINELTPQIMFGEDGFSIMPYSFEEMNEKLLDAYDDFDDNHDFLISFNSRLKPVLISEAMSYAHIAGVYTFFTGESNINMNLPDYTIPYTAAHELAHQRGVSREDEANMIAFLVCIRSNDPYIQYSAYLNMYEYVAAALQKADRDEYNLISRKLDLSVYNELLAYSEFFKKYKKSVTSQVSGTVNDVFLKVQGTEGRASYGMVVDLTVAYFKSENIID